MSTKMKSLPGKGTWACAVCETQWPDAQGWSAHLVQGRCPAPIQPISPEAKADAEYQTLKARTRR